MVLTSMLPWILLSAVQEPSAEWILAKHEESLARIHSLRATIESRGSFDGGATWRLMDTMRFVRSGSRERVAIAIETYPNNGVLEDAPGFQVMLSTLEGSWGLDGVDPDHPPSESVAYIDREVGRKIPRITGRITAPRTRGAHGYDGSPGPTSLGFAVRSDQSLRALYEASGNVTPVQGRDGRGDPTWVLRLKGPEGYFLHEVHFNPKYGYMISARRDSGALSSNRNIVTDWQVEEFQQPVPGIFIAKKTRRTVKRPEFKTPLIVVDTITVSDVNRPIPESELQPRYPAGVLVGDERDQTFNIWGDDGKPALTFKSHSEFKKWREQQILQRLKARPAWWQEPAALVVLGAAVLLVMLLAYRSCLVKRERAAA